MADLVTRFQHLLASVRIGFQRVPGDEQVAGIPCFFQQRKDAPAPITPNSPRDTGVGVVMPRAIQPDIASKSKLMQTMCFAITGASSTRARFLSPLSPLRDVGLDELAELLGRICRPARNRNPRRAPEFRGFAAPW